MNPYLIALDLDGTLLTDEKKISLRTKNTLAKAQEQGHIVCIATGRPYRGSVQYYEELSLNTPIVNFNGAFTHHPKDERFGTYHTPLDLDIAKTILRTCEAFRVKNVMVEIIDDFYLRHYDQVLLDTFMLGRTPVEYGNLDVLLTNNPTSILVQPRDEHLHDLRSLLQEAHAEVTEQRVWTAPWSMIEIIKAGQNKAIGLEKIANYYGIPQERVIAFGDEDNDLEMIEYAGYGIAMKNGISELKKIATDITRSNEEDGVAVYLEKLLDL